MHTKYYSKTIKILAAAIVISQLSACSESSNENEAYASSSYISLPTDSSSPVDIEGEITFWMWEGDAGCYGEINSAGNVIELWSEADLCVDEKVTEGEVRTLSIIFEQDMQPYLNVNDKPVYSVVGYDG